MVTAVDPELKGRGQASFIVPPKTKGLSQGQKYLKHGIRTSHTAEVVLEDVRVPGRAAGWVAKKNSTPSWRATAKEPQAVSN